MQQVCRYLQQSHVMPLLKLLKHLTTLRWTDVTMDIMWLFILMTILPYICNCIMGFSNRLKAFNLQMVVWAPMSATASSNYYLGALDQRPSIWENMLHLNVRPETIKPLEENTGKTLSDINHSRILYDPPPRILEIKAKINKWELIKCKSFCTKKETKQGKKTAFRLGEDNSKRSNKGLISKI